MRVWSYRFLIFLVTLGSALSITRIVRFEPISDESFSRATASVKVEVAVDPVAIRSDLAQTQDEETFEIPPPAPDGVYFPTEDGKFKVETALLMTTYEGKNYGSIKIGDAFLESSLVFGSKDEVTLMTKDIEGLRYEFKGRFLKDGFKTYFDDGELVLKGTLTKYQGSRKIYTISSRYIFAREVCAWNPNNQ